MTFSLLSDDDLFFFNEGTHQRIYDRLGAHAVHVAGVSGTYFAVWAPDADYVSVVGEWNRWDSGKTPMKARGASGIWEAFVPGVGHGQLYKYFVSSRYQGYKVLKSDPVAFLCEMPPKTASVVWELGYEWRDRAWMEKRSERQSLHAPMAIYEVHLGSFRHVPEEGNRSLSYREHATWLVDYVKRMGFTHVEFMPIMEHPFYATWGYGVTGYFAPTHRYGLPEDLMFLIDTLHQNDIGVILDWVPAHFPNDEHGLSFFDGTHLYEHDDPRKGFHPDWNSLIFNYGRNEVRSFLLSSALFWLDKYHVDALRIDGVASMLYLDYSRKEGEWIPNPYGGKENVDAIGFLRMLNEAVYQRFPGAQTIAEESTAWPMVSRPTYVGGLGFGLKWDMGWMHDTLQYFARDPVHRRFHQSEITFRMIYAFNENFVLPLSHDEVVHGKGSLLSKMPGDEWQKFANLRLLFGYMYALPGKKLLFMGGEFAQPAEWNHNHSIEWHVLEHAPHVGIQQWVRDLNLFYRDSAAMHELDCETAGFEWLDASDADQSVMSFFRLSKDANHRVLVVCNFTPVVRSHYRVGVPTKGEWTERLNGDASAYGGSGQGNLGRVTAEAISSHGRPYSLQLTLPPLGILFLEPT